jgi:thiaminase/transcriptional activator TenA
MADGTLSEAAFRHYLVQDYLFLIEFARAYALAVYKAPHLDDLREAAFALASILDVEMNLHVKLCAGWGLCPTTSSELLRPPRCWPKRGVLDTGMRGDLLTLKVVLAPASSATRRSRRGSRANSARVPRRTPIASGSTSMPAPYQDVAAKPRANLDRLADRYATPTREAELIAMFKEATRLETDFWAMGCPLALVVISTGHSAFDAIIVSGLTPLAVMEKAVLPGCPQCAQMRTHLSSARNSATDPNPTSRAWISRRRLPPRIRRPNLEVPPVHVRTLPQRPSKSW